MVIRPGGFTGNFPFLFEGPLTRTVEDAAIALTALSGYDARDPFSLDEDVDFTAALRGSVSGWRIAYSPNLDVYPVDPRVSGIVSRAVRAFEEAGAHVEEVSLGLRRDQRELSDLWCRMIMFPNVETLENFKSGGLDLLGDHRDDFPPEYLAWVEKAYRLTRTDLVRDHQLRTEVYDAIQGVLADHDLLVTPTLADLAVPNADDGNTVGPRQVDGVEVDPLIGWCLTYLTNFLRPSVRVDPGRPDRGQPACRDAADRQALRGRGRPDRERRVRAAPALARHLRAPRDGRGLTGPTSGPARGAGPARPPGVAASPSRPCRRAPRRR